MTATAAPETEPRSVIRTERAPAPYQGAPYSQAIRVGELVFVSGQVSLDPETHEVVGESIREQTERVLSNLEAILAAAGSGLDRLVKTTVYLTDWANFEGMNEVYARRIGTPPPARATAGISLPPGLLVEIDAVAVAA
jgi:2-iminobutanoate/2-iminopropanoate deaminase